MSISTELIVSLLVQIVTVGFFAGTYVSSISFMKEQIKELREDMHRYNSVLERIALAENNIKSAHKRIDELQEP